uniref:Uncharacterized protein n=1 Tax=Rangifer tarandus platyrhynchus TaxID=3082113 RepID=A0ACB0EW77_RANTA|nr:unnamed protein product [Rangifer tarandus platyrhynchus]
MWFLDVRLLGLMVMLEMMLEMMLEVILEVMLKMILEVMLNVMLEVTLWREDPALEGGERYPREGSGCQSSMSSRGSRGTWGWQRHADALTSELKRAPFSPGKDKVPRLGTGWAAMATRGCRAPKAIRNFNTVTAEREPRVGRVTPGLEGSPAQRGGAGTVGWPFASGPPFPRL